MISTLIRGRMIPTVITVETLRSVLSTVGVEWDQSIDPQLVPHGGYQIRLIVGEREGIGSILAEAICDLEMDGRPVALRSAAVGCAQR